MKIKRAIISTKIPEISFWILTLSSIFHPKNNWIKLETELFLLSMNYANDLAARVEWTDSRGKPLAISLADILKMNSSYSPFRTRGWMNRMCTKLNFPRNNNLQTDTRNGWKKKKRKRKHFERILMLLRYSDSTFSPLSTEDIPRVNRFLWAIGIQHTSSFSLPVEFQVQWTVVRLRNSSFVPFVKL